MGKKNPLQSIVQAVNPISQIGSQFGAIGNIAQGKNPLDPMSIVSKYGGVGAAVAAGALTPQQAQSMSYDGSTLSDMERRAGVLAPKYESFRNEAGNKLRKEFTMDPTKSDAFSAIKNQAMNTGPSAWAQLALQKQGLEQQNATDLASKQLQQGQSMAAGNLARIGGLGGGARTRMAMQGAKDLMLQQQGIGRNGKSRRVKENNERQYKENEGGGRMKIEDIYDVIWVCAIVLITAVMALGIFGALTGCTPRISVTKVDEVLCTDLCIKRILYMTDEPFDGRAMEVIREHCKEKASTGCIKYCENDGCYIKFSKE